MSATNANRVSHFWASQNNIYVSRHRTLKNQYLHLGDFCLCTPLLLYFSGTYLLKLSFSQMFVTRWSVSVVIVFPFLGVGFANIPPTFFISCEVQTKYSKTLKYSQQYIWGYLSGTKLRIWVCSEYDAIFNFSCIALCNITESFTFSFIPFSS